MRRAAQLLVFLAIAVAAFYSDGCTARVNSGVKATKRGEKRAGDTPNDWKKIFESDKKYVANTAHIEVGTPEEIMDARVVSTCPGFGFSFFSPVVFMRVVNYLTCIGKTRALAAIRRYLQAVSGGDFRVPLPGLPIRLLLAALFTLPNSSMHPTQELTYGLSRGGVKDIDACPTYPLLVVMDLPVMLDGPSFTGIIESIENLIRYCDQVGTFKQAMWCPTESLGEIGMRIGPRIDQLDLYRLAEENDRQGKRDYLQRMVMDQLLRATGNTATEDELQNWFWDVQLQDFARRP